MSVPVSSQREEDGAVLVVTLIFLGVWAVVIGAVLQFSEVGFDTIRDARDRTQLTYALDGALEARLAFLATSRDVRCGEEPGDWGRPASLDGVPPEPMTLNVRSVDVECREFPMPGGVRRVDLRTRGADSEIQASAMIDHSVVGPGGSGDVTVTTWAVIR